jgi:hypothetical protein
MFRHIDRWTERSDYTDLVRGLSGFCLSRVTVVRGRV